MTNPARAALALLAAAALAAGCGSDEVDPTTQAAQTAPLTASVPAVTTAPPATVPTTPTVTAPVITTPATTPGTTTTPATTPADPGDEQAARQAIQDYVDAFVAADGDKACALLTPQVQQAFLEAVRSQVNASTCAEAFSAAAGQASEEQRNAFRNAEISGLQVSGDTASGTLTVQGIAAQFQLQRLDGAWKVANLPGS